MGTNHILNAKLRFQNYEMKSIESGDELDHFECDFGLDCVF